ncbi:MAG: hypothetical protein JXA25_05195 [Anaerolineales bacterium]|nr:hypothetical protein [Anaerolineales bacterium]
MWPFCFGSRQFFNGRCLHLILQNKRVNNISEFENQRGTRVFELISHQVSMSFPGFPVSHYADIQDLEDVLRAKKSDPNVILDLILYVPGGLALVVEQLA